MDIFHAFLLGLVQGLGEFLPISSSAHLVLVPWLFGFPDPGLGFNVALHWGTLLAVLVYFRRDVWQLVVGFCKSVFPKTRNFKTDTYQGLAWLIIIASIPAAVIGKLLEGYAEHAFRNPLLIASTLLVFGIVILFADMLGKKLRSLNALTATDAFLIGLSQVLALVPGVSRSGSTMTAGLALGLKRADTARFSFLMSIPIIFGAGLLKIGDFTTGVSPASFAVGFVTSAVFGFLSIKFLLKLLSHGTFKMFVWYRIGLAVLIVAVYLFRTT